MEQSQETLQKKATTSPETILHNLSAAFTQSYQDRDVNPGSFPRFVQIVKLLLQLVPQAVNCRAEAVAINAFYQVLVPKRHPLSLEERKQIVAGVTKLLERSWLQGKADLQTEQGIFFL